MGDGKPGGWLRKQMHLDLLVWAGGIVVLFPVWLIWVPHPWWAYWPTMTLALYLDRKGRRQFGQWWKGARGEEAVARELEPLAARGYRIIHDVDKGYGNIDHIVVGPTGVFVLETKAWRGRVYPAVGGRLMRNGRDEKKTQDQVMGNVLHVRRRLLELGMKVWVNGLVVLTATSLPRGAIRLRHATVIMKNDLLQIIGSGPQRLAEPEIHRAADALGGSRGSPQFARRNRVA
jgi:Nuclease-related domain